MSRQSRDQRASVEAFRAMYGEVVGSHARQQQRLQRFDPTDVQAEVLLVDVIEPQFIRRAVFSDSAVRQRYLPSGSDLRSTPCINSPNSPGAC